MRTLVPGDTLVYLETRDLGAALQPIMANRDASSPIDVSGLNGVQLAVAITGIETSEQKINDEQSNAQVKPKFVAVADTHTWNFYAVRFAEAKLGAFVERIYGSRPTLEEPDHPGGGRDIVWTAADGRKAFAFVTGSIVYFSNDRESLDKALAIRSGGANLASTGKVQVPPSDALAGGYASAQGVSQIADIAGLRSAASAGEDAQVQSAVAAILPQLIREMVSDVTWEERRAPAGVIDTYQARMPDNVASALKDTQPGDLNDRLRNTVIALLTGSKLDDRTRTAVADAIVNSVKGGEGSQTRFTSTGIERSTTSESGLLGAIVAALATSSSPPA